MISQCLCNVFTMCSQKGHAHCIPNVLAMFSQFFYELTEGKLVLLFEVVMALVHLVCLVSILVVEVVLASFVFGLSPCLNKEGEAEEELLALEDNNDVDKQVEAKAVDQVGGNILSLQQHIVEMDQAGDQAAADLQAPLLPPPEVPEVPAEKVPQLPAVGTFSAPSEEPQTEVANSGEGVAEPSVVPQRNCWEMTWQKIQMQQK